MVYAPQRRHAVASLAMTTQAIGLMQQLYTPNMLILIARVLAQVQITGAAYIHPQQSLFALFLLLTMLNIAAGFLHLLDFVGGMNGGKGLMLDFVGQANPASLTRVILLDLLLYILQLSALIVSYVNNHSKDLSASPAFPYKDLLLPPSDHSTVSSTATDDDVDLEAGERKRRRRKANGSYQSDEDDENELWLNEENDYSSTSKRGASSLHPLLSTSTPYRRIHEPPLIFSLPLPHIIQLIFHLPAPTPTPPAFAGGTPLPSPLPTPTTDEPTSILSNLPEAGEEAEMSEDEEEVGHRMGGGSPSSRRRGRVRGAAGLMPEVGRIPGEYQLRSGSGNGG